jgi:hypothetical protein
MRLILIGLAALALSGCMEAHTGCAGFRKLNPSAGTRSYIVANDQAFARDVVGHNEFGSKRGCW